MRASSPKVFVASRLPVNPGISGWVATLPVRQARQQLCDHTTADVVIIGGGFAGLSAARRLSELDPGLRIAVLEAGIIGDAAAGRNSGFIIDLPHEVSSEDYGGNSAARSREAIAVSRTAIAMATAVAEEQGWSRNIFDPCGRYSVAISAEGDRHLVKYADGLKELGEEHKLLDAGEIAAITGVATYTSGLFMPGTVMVQPAAYIRGFADSLRPPVTVFENSPALRITGDGGEWKVETARGSIATAKIILANNGHAESFGFFERRLLHVFTWASMTKPFGPARLSGQRKWAATPALPMGTTVRRIESADGDRILIRSRYTYHHDIKAGGGTLARAGVKHDEKFRMRFPKLVDVPMEYRWGGALALTWNAVPAFGEIERGIIAACGCNGVGATKATGNGIAAAELLLGTTSRLTEIFSRLEAPKLLPMQPFRTIGAKANLAYKEWRAGAE